MAQPIPFGSTPITKPDINTQDLVKNKKPIPFGAPPVSFPTGEPPSSHLSFMQRLGNAFKALPGQAVSDIKGGIQNVKDIGSNVIQDFKEGGQNIIEDVKKTSFSPDYNPKTQQNIGTTVLDLVGTVAKTALSPITQTINKFTTDTAEKLAALPSFQNFANSKYGDALAHKEESITEAYNGWAKENPELAKDLTSSFNVANLALMEKAAPKVANTADAALTKVGEGGKAILDTTKGATEKAIPTIKDIAGGYKQMATDIVDQTVGKSAVNRDIAEIADKNINAIQEKISPKITSKETQAIINEGRLTRGKESILFGKKPDIVAQSEAVQQSADTINRLIPKAAKMSDADLSTSITGKIGEISTDLKPQMKATPVKIETLGKVRDTWNTLKAEQQTRPEFMDHQSANVQFQKQFENYLSQLNRDIKDPVTGKFKAPTKQTMQNVWDIRQAYDDSVPANVKEATTASPPQYQVRKDMWLENRAILNSAIHDTADGLGSYSKNAFADMSRLYDAKENIASKAKIDLEGKPGALPATKKDFLKWGIGAGATLVGGEWVLKKLGF